MTFKTLTQMERIAMLEVQVHTLTTKVDSMDAKLDELLSLKYKGIGAFWLASLIVGTGIAGVLVQVLGWIRG